MDERSPASGERARAARDAAADHYIERMAAIHKRDLRAARLLARATRAELMDPVPA